MGMHLDFIKCSTPTYAWNARSWEKGIYSVEGTPHTASWSSWCLRCLIRPTENARHENARKNQSDLCKRIFIRSVLPVHMEFSTSLQRTRVERLNPKKLYFYYCCPCLRKVLPQYCTATAYMHVKCGHETRGGYRNLWRGGAVPPVPYISRSLSISSLPPLSLPLRSKPFKPARRSGGAL